MNTMRLSKMIYERWLGTSARQAELLIIRWRATMTSRSIVQFSAFLLLCWNPGCSADDLDVDDVLERSREFEASGNCAAAIREIDTIVDSDSLKKSPKLTVNCSRILHSCGESKRALGVLRSCESAETEASIGIEIGDINLDIGKPREALRAYTEALELAPKNPELHFRRGICFEDTQAVEDAIDSYSVAITLRSGYRNALINRARLYLESQQFQKVIDDLLVVVEDDGDSQAADVHFYLAKAYLGLKKYSVAFQHTHEAIGASRYDQQGIYTLRGDILSESDRLGEAIREYGIAIDLEPEYWPAHFNLGVAYQSLGKHERAIRDFERALKANAPEFICYKAIGISYLELNESLKAKVALEKALRLQPNDEQVKEYLWEVENGDEN